MGVIERQIASISQIRFSNNPFGHKCFVCDRLRIDRCHLAQIHSVFAVQLKLDINSPSGVWSDGSR